MSSILDFFCKGSGGVISEQQPASKRNNEEILIWNQYGLVKRSKLSDSETTARYRLKVHCSSDIFSTFEFGHECHPSLSALCENGCAFYNLNRNSLVVYTFMSAKRYESWMVELGCDYPCLALCMNDMFVSICSSCELMVFLSGGILLDRISISKKAVSLLMLPNRTIIALCKKSKHSFEAMVYEICQELQLRKNIRFSLSSDDFYQEMFLCSLNFPIILTTRMKVYALIDCNHFIFLGSCDDSESICPINLTFASNEWFMRYYNPSITINIGGISPSDYREVKISCQEFFSEEDYINSVQKSLISDRSIEKNLRTLVHFDESKEFVLMDLFMHALSNKADLLAVAAFRLLNDESKISKALLIAQKSNNTRLYDKLLGFNIDISGELGKGSYPKIITNDVKESFVASTNIPVFKNSVEIFKQSQLEKIHKETELPNVDDVANLRCFLSRKRWDKKLLEDSTKKK